MPVFAIAILLSAFLLFQVQPIVAKAILPWFGSSPAVWTTCMLFFQTLLVGGYAYAHGIATYLSQRMQALVHLGLLVLAMLTLPITPTPPSEVATDNPTWQIMAILAASVGVPYTLLSASGPLFQSWFSRRYPDRSQYRLYAVSNIGSLGGLLTYPVLIEPYLTLSQQGSLWSIGFFGLALAAGACVWRLLSGTSLVVSAVDVSPSEIDNTKLPWTNVPLWFFLPAVGTAILLASTNQMCQEVAVIPFLWVLPLSLYLISFILCFDSDRWYRRTPILIATCIGTILIVLVRTKTIDFKNLWPELLIYTLTTFTACMGCHGELARLRPSGRWSTLFYLFLSLGGALGGSFVAILAPQLFLRYWELDLGLAAACLIPWAAMVWENRSRSTPPETWSTVKMISLGILVLSVDLCLGLNVIQSEQADVIGVDRNFYGIITVRLNGVKKVQRDDGQSVMEANLANIGVSMYHGEILHGMQFQSPDRRARPNLYFNETSGIGRAILHHPNRQVAGRPFRIGVIGLGTGTVATYGRNGDIMKFYEINPGVIQFADEVQAEDGMRYFNYLEDARQRGVAVSLHVGDGRRLLTLEHEAMQASGNNTLSTQFDVLAVDAFSGDAIPLHLMTQESLGLYFEHIGSDGIIAFNVSNLYLDVAPIVLRLAKAHQAEAIRIVTKTDTYNAILASRWVLVTRNQQFIAESQEWPETLPWAEYEKDAPLWKDDFCSILPTVIWW